MQSTPTRFFTGARSIAKDGLIRGVPAISMACDIPCLFAPERYAHSFLPRFIGVSRGTNPSYDRIGTREPQPLAHTLWCHRGALRWTGRISRRAGPAIPM